MTEVYRRKPICVLSSLNKCEVIKKLEKDLKKCDHISAIGEPNISYDSQGTPPNRFGE